VCTIGCESGTIKTNILSHYDRACETWIDIAGGPDSLIHSWCESFPTRSPPTCPHTILLSCRSFIASGAVVSIQRLYGSKQSIIVSTYFVFEEMSHWRLR
jgi:hypothetical protein